MDYLKKIIEQAAEKMGSKAALAEHLELSRTNISDVLAGKRGLPPIAQDKLEKLMKLEGGALRAPSEIITEKAPEKVAYWKKKIVELEAMAVCLVLAIVTTLVTPNPVQAAPLSQVVDSTVYIMSNLRRRISAVFRQLSTTFFLQPRFAS